MHTRRLVKRSILGSRVYAPPPPPPPPPHTPPTPPPPQQQQQQGDVGMMVTGGAVVQAVKQENRDVSFSSFSSSSSTSYTVLLQDGSLKELSEEEVAASANHHHHQHQHHLLTPARGPLKPSLKHNSNNGFGKGPKEREAGGGHLGAPEDQQQQQQQQQWLAEGKRLGRPLDPEARSVSLLEQKRKVVSSSIDVPHARRSEEEVDMDKVTAAMVLTSLSTSPLVRSPPVKVSDGLSGSWKDTVSAGPFTPSSYSSSGGYWSWSAPSDQSNPSTPSPPLSADGSKPFKAPPGLGNGGPSAPGPEDPSLEDQDGSSLLFDEPIPRKRKNSMKVMFKCLWKNCGKVLSTAAGIQRHIRTVHLGRNCDSDWSDGEEDFYYTEIKLNADPAAAGAEGLGGGLTPASPAVLSPPHPPPPHPPPPHLPPHHHHHHHHQHHQHHPAAGGGDAHLPPTLNNHNHAVAVAKDNHGGACNGRLGGGGGGGGGGTPLSRSAPSALYLIHTDHAYQATPPVSIPSNGSSSSSCGGPPLAGFAPTNSFSISWQSPPVTFTGNASVSPSKSQGFSEQRSQTIGVLSSPPRATGALSRKVRGEGKKCRKVYGMENRDMWCTACRWKKACQRFTD